MSTRYRAIFNRVLSWACSIESCARCRWFNCCRRVFCFSEEQRLLCLGKALWVAFFIRLRKYFSHMFENLLQGVPPLVTPAPKALSLQSTVYQSRKPKKSPFLRRLTENFRVLWIEKDVKLKFEIKLSHPEWIILLSLRIFFHQHQLIKMIEDH